MARERLSVGVRKDIVIDGVAKQAEIVRKDGQKLTIKCRSSGKGRFGKPYAISSKSFWQMVDAAA